MPPRIFINVDFPAPFSPTSATISPGRASSETLLSATTPGNRLPIPCISSNGVVVRFISNWYRINHGDHGDYGDHGEENKYQPPRDPRAPVVDPCVPISPVLI